MQLQSLEPSGENSAQVQPWRAGPGVTTDYRVPDGKLDTGGHTAWDSHWSELKPKDRKQVGGAY